MRSFACIIAGVAVLTGTACKSATSGDACSGSGAAASVDASDALQFSPSGVTILHGQSVCWENNGSLTHTVTSDDGTSFNLGLPSGSIHSHRFMSPGSFPYHCTFHLGMTGSVTVN